MMAENKTINGPRVNSLGHADTTLYPTDIRFNLEKKSKILVFNFINNLKKKEINAFIN